MRSALGVRSRVWFRTHDSGTFHRAASSADSINSKPLQSLGDINWTSAVAVLMLSAAYGCMAVTVTAITRLIWAIVAAKPACKQRSVPPVRVEISRLSRVYAAWEQWDFHSRDASCASARAW